jgi:hypothetical protein
MTRSFVRLRYLLDKAGPVSRQPWIAIPPPENWVDDSESIVLIGEAAHPQGVCAWSTLTRSFFCFLII